MRQFNLDEYSKNPDQKLVNRSGDSARILCTDLMDMEYPIVVAVNYCKKKEFVISCSKDGHFPYTSNTADLFFVD